MKHAFLLMGSNIGDRKMNLQDCSVRLKAWGIQILSQSSVYETDAWGNTDQRSFYNQAIKIGTELLPDDLLITLKKIEVELGRIENERWGERIIDIDILYYEHSIVEKGDLSIPHRELANRRFALIPLCEIAPGHIHPVLKVSNFQLLEVCPDPLIVRKIE